VESAESLVAQAAGMMFGDAFAGSWHNYGATTTAAIPSTTTVATTAATTTVTTYHLTATGGASGKLFLVCSMQLISLLFGESRREGIEYDRRKLLIMSSNSTECFVFNRFSKD
jgi:hypothetical protein